MRFVLVPAFAVLVLFVPVSHRAYAQEPKRLTMSAGYQDMVYTIAQNEDPLPPGFAWVCPDPNRGCQFSSASYSVHGLYVDVAGQVSTNIAVVGEWAWNRSKDAGLLGGDPDDPVPGTKVSVHQFSGGLRFSVTRERFVPFAQLLVGGARVAAGIPHISESLTAMNLHAGAGVDLMFNSQVGLRGFGSYMRLFTSDVRRNNLAQFGVGIVFKR
jgi:hypothetical protein